MKTFVTACLLFALTSLTFAQDSDTFDPDTVLSLSPSVEMFGLDATIGFDSRVNVKVADGPWHVTTGAGFFYADRPKSCPAFPERPTDLIIDLGDATETELREVFGITCERNTPSLRLTYGLSYAVTVHQDVMYLGLTSHVLTLGPERSVVLGPEVQIFDERTIYVRFGGGYDLLQEGRTLLYLGIGKGFAL